MCLCPFILFCIIFWSSFVWNSCLWRKHFPSYKLSCGLQLSYPRSNTVRKGWVLRQIGKLLVFVGLMSFITEQVYNYPIFTWCLSFMQLVGFTNLCTGKNKTFYHQTYIQHLDLLYSPICHLIMFQSLEFLYLCPISKLHNTGLLAFWHCGSTLIQQSRTPSTLLRATLCWH